jgi:hypothetical protein
MAQTGIIVKPIEVDKYIFHIVKVYTILQTVIAFGEAIFENDAEVCAKIEDDFVDGSVAQRDFQKGGKRLECELRKYDIWNEITFDAMRLQLGKLLAIVEKRGGRCVELNSVAQKLPQLFKLWSSTGPLSPSAVREKYFINSLDTTRATMLMHNAISSESAGESAEGSAGAAKSTLAAPPLPAQAVQATTLWDWLCCCGKAKPEEPEQATAASPLVSSKGQRR